MYLYHFILVISFESWAIFLVHPQNLSPTFQSTPTHLLIQSMSRHHPKVFDFFPDFLPREISCIYFETLYVFQIDRRLFCMQFVFCILFLCSLIPLKKSSLKCFNKFIVIFIISNIREGKGVNAQNYVFYFESDIAKVFPFIPTCSSSDSEIKNKKSKRAKKDQQRK